MMTEQEVLAYINDKVSKGELSPVSLKYLEKLNVLDKSLQQLQADVQKLQNEAAQKQQDISRTRGAVSMLLELVAEEEGLLANPEPKE